MGAAAAAGVGAAGAVAVARAGAGSDSRAAAAAAEFAEWERAPSSAWDSEFQNHSTQGYAEGSREDRGSGHSSALEASEPPLPPGWIKCGPDEQGRVYYDHPATCHTQWERPTAPIVKPSATALEVAALVWKSGAGELPPHWDHDTDDSSGETYFITPDDQTTWDDPRENWLTCASWLKQYAISLTLLAIHSPTASPPLPLPQ